MKSVAAVALAASLLSVAHGVFLRNEIKNQLFAEADPSTEDMDEDWCPEACNGCYGNGENLTSCDEGIDMMQCIVKNVPELEKAAAQVPSNITDILYLTYFSSWGLCDAPEAFDGCTVPSGIEGAGTADMECGQINSYLKCGATNAGLTFDEAESGAIETLVVSITECQPSKETKGTKETDTGANDEQWCPEACNGCYGMGVDLKSCEEGLDMMRCVFSNTEGAEAFNELIPSAVSDGLFQSYFSAWGLCDVPQALENCTAPTGPEGEGTEDMQCDQIKSYLNCGAESAGIKLDDEQKSIVDEVVEQLTECEGQM